MAKDRISEAYLGFMSERMKNNSRERINWILSRIDGNSVLDVGCSQGIVEYLIDNTVKIVGIDNDPDAISYAQKLVADKEGGTENISFIVGDFLSKDLSQYKFDTIIMCEVLEHLHKPEKFLERANQLLDRGTLIVTVPFGINRHPDHKQTFYANDILSLITERFYVNNLEFVGNCIAIVADNKSNPGMYISEEELAHLQRNAYYDKEDEYLDRINTSKASNDTLKDKLSSLTDNYESLKNNYGRICDESDNYKSMIKDYKKMSDEYRDMVSEYRHREEVKEKEYLSVKEDYDALKESKSEKIVFLENENDRLRAQINGVRALLSDEERKRKIYEKKCSLVKASYSEKREAFLQRSAADFFESIKDEVNQIPESKSGRYYEKFDISIGIIADEFLYDSWKDAANFVYLTPENWVDEVDNTEFLIVASTWKGLGKVWDGAAYEGRPQRELVFSVIDAYKKLDKTVVFYSKEDPPNYDYFLDFAKKSDYIFTTCKEIVNRYRTDCKNDNVNVLCFSINPLFHNPVGMHTYFRKNEVVFSGSWMNKYPSRQTDIQMLLDGVVDSGKKLHIIDRNYEIPDEHYLFPERFWEYISPSVDHDVLQKVHKLYDWAIDINSINESETMFANRGYELLASGNILISNYSVGVHNKLPWIYTAASAKEISDTINSLAPEERYKWQIDGIRSVMTGATCYDRLKKVLNTIGISVKVTSRSVLVVADKIEDNIQKQFDMQSYPNKVLIAEKDLTEENYSKYDIIATWKSGCEYHPFYLEDMVNAFKYTTADYITKDAYLENGVFNKGIEHDFVTRISAKHRTIFWRSSYSFSEYEAITSGQSLDNGYSIDHFNYDEAIQRKSNENKNAKLTVITHIPKNKETLHGKLLRSLLHNENSDEIDVLILSDDEKMVTESMRATYGQRNVRYLLSSSMEEAISHSCDKIFSDYICLMEPQDELYVNSCLQLIHSEAPIIMGNCCVVKPTSQRGVTGISIDILSGTKCSDTFLIKVDDYKKMVMANRVLFEKNKFALSLPETQAINHSDLVTAKIYRKNNSFLDVMYYGKFKWIEDDKYRCMWQKLISEASKVADEADTSNINWQEFFEELATRNADGKNIQALNVTIDKDKKTIANQKTRIEALDARVAHLEKSYSYKLGLLITFIPRKLVHLITRK